jgi:hypothetical protein
MADEKKGSGIQSDSKTVEQITFLLVGLLLLGALATAILNYIDNLNLGAANSFWARLVDYFLTHLWPIWKFVAAIVSVLALVGIIYNSLKLRAINIEENKFYGVLPGASVLGEKKIIEPKNEKWEKVLKQSYSDNPSDWRLAVIEADVILEDLLKTLGYQGESVGEMLKSVDKSEFLSIEDAWEAHKIRNAVAHSGENFQLNERETKRVIALFEKVFREFDII